MNIASLLSMPAVSATSKSSNTADAGVDSHGDDFSNVMKSTLINTDKPPEASSRANGMAQAQEKTAWLANLFRDPGETTPDPSGEASSQAPTEPLTIQKLINLLQLLSQSQLGQTGEGGDEDSSAQGIGQLASFLAALKNASKDDSAHASLATLLSLLLAAMQPGVKEQTEAGAMTPTAVDETQTGISSLEAMEALQQIFGDKDLSADLSNNPKIADFIARLTELSQQPAANVSVPSPTTDADQAAIDLASASQSATTTTNSASTTPEVELAINPAAAVHTSPNEEAPAAAASANVSAEGGAAANNLPSFASLLAANKTTAEVAANPAKDTANQSGANPTPPRAATADLNTATSNAASQTVGQLSAQNAPSLTGATEAGNVVNLPGIPALHQIVNTIRSATFKGDSEVRLNLKPESLGQLHIRLSMNDGVVSIRMIAETGQAQALINEHLPQLKAALTAQGLQLDQLAVSTSSNPGNFNSAERQADGGFDSQFQQAGDGSTPLNLQGEAVSSSDPRRISSLYTVDYRV
jgi:flagellar hook-length control protein FliK